MMNGILQWPRRIVRFYVDGFRSMTIGRKLWTVIIIKLIVIFGVLKLFFFPIFSVAGTTLTRSAPTPCVHLSPYRVTAA